MTTEEQMEFRDMRARERDSLCAVCESPLVIKRLNGQYALVCTNDPNHYGLENVWKGIKRRREREMSMGQDNARAVAKYESVVALTKPEAHEILTTLWPAAEKASPAEFMKAMVLCTQYGLNPAKGHLFLIPFEKKNKEGKVIGVTHECIMAMDADRLIASRNHRWTYLERSPRRMTKDEEIEQYGEVNEEEVRSICHLKDLDTGAEAWGFGVWPKSKVYANGAKYPNTPKGAEKGNTMQNMANIHAERNCLDRLYPADMPHLPGVRVADGPMESTRVPLSSPPTGGNGAGIDKSTGEIIDGEYTDEDQQQGQDMAKEIEQRKATASPPPARAKAPAPRKDPPARELDTIKSNQDMLKCCNDDFGWQPKRVLAELGVGSTSELVEAPFQSYLKAKAIWKATCVAPETTADEEFDKLESANAH